MTKMVWLCIWFNIAIASFNGALGIKNRWMYNIVLMLINLACVGVCLWMLPRARRLDHRNRFKL